MNTRTIPQSAKAIALILPIVLAMPSTGETGSFLDAVAKVARGGASSGYSAGIASSLVKGAATAVTAAAVVTACSNAGSSTGAPPQPPELLPQGAFDVREQDPMRAVAQLGVGGGALVIPSAMGNALGDPSARSLPALAVDASVLFPFRHQPAALGITAVLAGSEEVVPGVGLALYEVGMTYVRFAGRKFGSGPFVRLGAGLGIVQVIFDRDGTQSHVDSPVGWGAGGGIGYAWKLRGSVSLTVEGGAKYRVVDGDGYSTLTVSTGVLFW